MRSTSVFSLAVTMLLASAIAVPGAETPPATHAIEELLKELRLLRSAVERLEKRVERLEQQRDNVVDQNPARPTRENESVDKAGNIRNVPPLPKHHPRISIDEWHQHEMPWRPKFPNSDKGLYIFP